MSESDIGSVPVKSASNPGAGVVTLGQIATIRRAPAPAWTRVTANGTEALLVNIRQTPTADAVSLVKAVDERLKSARLPPDVKVSPFYDQSELVLGAANSVRDAILLGAFLAGLVLFAFLRSWRLMVMTAALLPAVLAATCVALSALGMSFNMMTLGGMAAAVGLVVDDAVVMLEHLMRRMQEAERGTKPSLLVAATEMARPLFGSTAATIVVFAPLAFISGVSGGFFKALAVTMTAALLVSLLYARYIMPLAAARWLATADVEAAEKADGFMGRIGSSYERLTHRAFARPAAFAGFAAAILILVGIVSWSKVQSGFMPKMDEGGCVLDYKAKPGAAIGDTDRLVRQVEKIIRATPEVVSYSRRTGLQLGGGLTEADEGDMFVRLKGGSRRDIEAVMTEVRAKIERQVPGLNVELIQLMEDLIGDLTAVPQPIEVKLFGDDPQVLKDTAGKVAEAIRTISGVVGVQDGLRVAGDAIIIKVDPAAAALAGLDPDAVAKQVEAQVGGTVATRLLAGEVLIDVRVRAPLSLRQRADTLGALPLRAADGRSVSLGRIAAIRIGAGQRQITREDLAPFIPVTARLEGLDLGSGIKAVQAKVTALKLPESVRVDYGGGLCAAEAIVPRFNDGIGCGPAALSTAPDAFVRTMGVHGLGHRHRVTIGVRRAGRAMAYRNRAGHFRLDGRDDGDRHADRIVDFLPCRACPRRAAHRRLADRSRTRAPAPHPDVRAHCDPNPASPCFGNRARLRTSAAAGNRDYCRTDDRGASHSDVTAWTRAAHVERSTPGYPWRDGADQLAASTVGNNTVHELTRNETERRRRRFAGRMSWATQFVNLDGAAGTHTNPLPFAATVPTAGYGK